MIIVPISINSDTLYDLFVILNAENVTRMKAADPGEVPMSSLPPEWLEKRLRCIVLCYCDDEEALMAKLEGDTAEALRWLSRGFVYRPDLGDHDGPPVVIGSSKESTH